MLLSIIYVFFMTLVFACDLDSTISAHATSYIPDSASITTHSIASSIPTSSPLCYHSGEHADEEELVMEFIADFTCKAIKNTNLTLVNEEDSVSFLMTFHDDWKHYLAIRWTPICKGPQSIAPSCASIMYNNWKQCKLCGKGIILYLIDRKANIRYVGKNSRGGFTTFGCLTYNYEALSDQHQISCEGSVDTCTIAY